MAQGNYREKKWNRCDTAELSKPAHSARRCERRFGFKAILILAAKRGKERGNNVILGLFKAES